MMSERKQCTQVELKDAEHGAVRAVFSTFKAIDADGDVTMPGAFDDGANVRISAYGHSSWHGELPVGRGKIKVEDDRAVLEGKFFTSTLRGKETFETIKQMGDLQEWSYGYDVVESEDGEFEGQPVRFLKKLKVHEVSPVLLGAGVGTQTISIKALKQEGFEVQTLIFPKARWESAAAAQAWAGEHDFRTEVDETETSYRLRQRDPDEFARLRTICIAPSRDTPMDDCRIQAVGGPVRESAGVAAPTEQELAEVKALVEAEHAKFQATRKRLGL